MSTQVHKLDLNAFVDALYRVLLSREPDRDGRDDKIARLTNGLVTIEGVIAEIAGSTEFVTSPAALPAFQTTYGFSLTPQQLVQLSGGDTAATIAAAARQTSGVNAAMVYGTDGGIEPAGLVVMEDDKGVQPVYQPAPVVRASVLAEYPAIAEVLNPIFAGFDLATLQQLNARIQVNGEPADAVARDYLQGKGLIK